MDAQRQKLCAIFSSPGWARFIRKLQRFRNAGRAWPTSVTLSEPTVEERRRLASLLRQNAPSLAGRLRYDLPSISQALANAQLPSDWGAIVEVICGPLPSDLLAARASAQAWNDLWSTAQATLGRIPFPASQEWIVVLRRDGILKRVSSGDAMVASQLLETSARLLSELPLSEEQPLAQTAARYCGNSHALDFASPLCTLVLRGLALRQKRELPSRVSDRRQLWSEFGVVCDTLSAPVLTFNLGIIGDAPLTKLTASAMSAIQPLHLTTHLIWATPWEILQCPEKVFVCENPTIVSLAAAHLGQKCPPLVCVDGEPKTAARLLFRALRKGGSKLFYHGDFDWPGLAIAERVFREFGALPWFFDAPAYREAGKHQGRPLRGPSVPSPWSPGLSEAMLSNGIAYDEELLTDELFNAMQEMRPY